MRRSERSDRQEGPLRVDEAGDAVDDARVYRLLLVQGREDGLEGVREERLPGPWRTDHQQVVPARRRDLECALRRLLPDDVGEIHLPAGCSRGLWRDRGRASRVTLEMVDGTSQRRDPDRLSPTGRGFRGVRGRDERRDDASTCGATHTGQHATHAADRSIERELPDAELGDVDRELTARAEDAERDREVESRAFLTALRGREVHRDPTERELEPAVSDRRAHPLARLAHGGVGEADDVEAGQPARDVDLDRHELGLETPQRAGGHAGKPGHRRRLPSPRGRVNGTAAWYLGPSVALPHDARVLATIAVALVAIAVHLPNLPAGKAPQEDAGVFLYAAQVLLDGGLPYRDV